MNFIKFKAFTFDFNIYFKAFIKSSIWLAFVFLCGSLPIILMNVLLKIGVVEANTKLEDFNHELFFPFLCCAIIGEISFEAFLCKVKFSKYSYMFFALSAFLVVGIVCVVYLTIFFSKPEKVMDLPATWLIQVLIVSFTLLYSLFIKTIMFVEEDKTYKLWQQQ